MDKYEILKNDYEDGIYRKSLYKCATCGYNALIRRNIERHVNGKRNNCLKYLNKTSKLHIYSYL